MFITVGAQEIHLVFHDLLTQSHNLNNMPIIHTKASHIVTLNK